MGFVSSKNWNYGYSLPQASYASDIEFAEDIRVIGDKQWLLIDHVSRIPNVGDYFLIDVGPENIIVVRTSDGIKAHYNVCRHRGSRICREPEGTKRVLVCPYHAWTYDLNGTLRKPPHMDSDFVPAESGLIPVNIAVEDGLIFINLNPGVPPDFEAFVAPLRPYFQPHRLDKAKIAARRSYPTDANWKLVVENFSECYHCGPAHKTFCSVHDRLKLLAMGAGPDSADAELSAAYQPILDAWNRTATAMGHFVGSFADSAETPYFQAGARLPIGEGNKTESIDGQPVAPLMGDLNDFDGGQTICVFNPITSLGCNNDHAVIFRFIPRSALRTDVEVMWLVSEEAVEGQDYDVEKIIAVWDITLREDKTITEDNQAGVLSSAYRPGRYSRQEKRIADFGWWYNRNLRN